MEAHDGQTDGQSTIDGRNGRCHGNEVTRCKEARDPYAACQISSWSDNRRWSYGDFSPTTQLAAVTLTSDPLTLKLVHGVLVSQGPFLPSLVFIGLFIFPLGGGTGQTNSQTDGQDQHMMGPPSRKDGPIKRPRELEISVYVSHNLRELCQFLAHKVKDQAYLPYGHWKIIMNLCDVRGVN